MCQPKPGPRCAGHLRDRIARVRADREQAMADFASGADATPAWHYNRELARLQDEYDETATGQRELGALIAQKVAENAPGYEIRDLQDRRVAAADRHAAKTAALQSTRAGDMDVARAQLRYGAHAGWFGASLLDKETDALGDFAVHPDHAVAITRRDEWDDSYGYEEEETPVRVSDLQVAYEAPVTPGPRPGTWLTGAHVPAKDRARLGVTPVLYDEAAHTVTAYPERQGPVPDATTPNPEPVDARTSRGFAVLDSADDFAVREACANDRLDAYTAEFRIVERPDGTKILRGDCQITGSATLPGHALYA